MPITTQQYLILFAVAFGVYYVSSMSKSTDRSIETQTFDGWIGDPKDKPSNWKLPPVRYNSLRNDVDDIYEWVTRGKPTNDLVFF